MIPAWPPTLDVLQRDISVDSDDTRDVEKLQECLDAAVSFVERVRPELNYARTFIGETVLLPFTVEDNVTTITISVTDPAGVVTTPAVTNPPVEEGRYVVAFVTTIAGSYTARWQALGPSPLAVRKAVAMFTVSELDGRQAPDRDMVLGTVRLASRWYARRLTPSALIELGDLGGARVPSFDADIERMLRIGKHRKSMTA